MSRASRTKGTRAEREVTNMAKAAGFQAARVPNSGGLEARGNGDVTGIPGVHMEVKRCERIEILKWLAQAEREASGNDLPVVAFRRNRGGWYAVLDLDELLNLLVWREL